MADKAQDQSCYTRKHRVLFVNGSAEVMWGAERCLLNIAKELVSQANSRRYEPVVCVSVQGPLVTDLETIGVPVYIMDFGTPRSRRELKSPLILWRMLTMLVGILRLALLIRRERIDVVHSNSSAVLAGAFAARVTGTPHVWHVREVIDRPRLLRAVMRRLQPRLSDRVICISRAVRDNFGKLPERMAGKLVILHDGIDLALFNGQQASGDGARSGQQVGMVARINAIKGHKTFIESAGLVAREIPGARFSIVGGCLPVYEPLKRELLTIAQHVGLDGRLRFLGQLEPEQVRDFMAHLDVLVMPTLIPEGFGLVMVEAMAMGKPVVATAHGGPLDVIRHGIDGLLVPPGNAAAMAEAIRYLLDSPRLRLAMGTAARHRAVELFSIQRQVEGLYRVYEQLVCH